MAQLNIIRSTEEKEQIQRKEIKTMMKVYGLNELAMMVEADNRIKKAEKEIKKNNIKRIEVEGVDPEIAKVMVNVFAEYNL